MKRAYSAPGKALVAGGYLVLDPQYCAYSVALSARIHAVVEFDANPDQTHTTTTIRCTSPQFAQGVWTYVASREDGRINDDTTPNSKNPFIESCVKAVMAYAVAMHKTECIPPHIDVTIYSDDAYHSRDHTATSGSEPTKQGRFTYHANQTIGEVPKTGLGSSAALSVCVTAALYEALVCSDSQKATLASRLNKIHTLAQISHCVAQGKIGSGFDVASATFGSVKYRRFPADIIPDELLQQNYDPSLVLRCVNDPRWTSECVHEPAGLPSGLRLLMGDVKSGSESPAMAAKVLGWRKANRERANGVWTQLNSANMHLVELLEQSSPELTELRSGIQAIRTQLQIMTRESGADIEPESQTKLLNALNEVPGVVGGLVPGAGGYDAICVLVVASEIEAIKAKTRELAQFHNVQWLDLHEDREGLCEEAVDQY